MASFSCTEFTVSPDQGATGFPNDGYKYQSKRRKRRNYNKDYHSDKLLDNTCNKEFAKVMSKCRDDSSYLDIDDPYEWNKMYSPCMRHRTYGNFDDKEFSCSKYERHAKHAMTVSSLQLGIYGMSSQYVYSYNYHGIPFTIHFPQRFGEGGLEFVGRLAILYSVDRRDMWYIIMKHLVSHYVCSKGLKYDTKNTLAHINSILKSKLASNADFDRNKEHLLNRMIVMHINVISCYLKCEWGYARPWQVIKIAKAQSLGDFDFWKITDMIKSVRTLLDVNSQMRSTLSWFKDIISNFQASFGFVVTSGSYISKALTSMCIGVVFSMVQRAFGSVTDIVLYMFKLVWENVCECSFKGFNYSRAALQTLGASESAVMIISMICMSCCSGLNLAQCVSVSRFTGSVTSSIFDNFKPILNLIFKHTLGVDWFMADDELPGLCDFITRVIEFTGKDNIRQTVITHKPDSEMAISLWYEFIKYRKAMMDNKMFNAKIKSDLLICTKPLEELYLSALTNSDFIHKRRTPIFVYITGPPGQGKTTLITALLSAVHHMLRKTNLKTKSNHFNQPYSASMTYNRVAGSEYWEGYYNQWATVYNEVFAEDSKEKKLIAASELLRCAENGTYCLNMAEAANKGRIFFTSEIIVVTSNCTDFTNLGLSTPEAFVRRIHFPINLKCNKRIDSKDMLNDAWLIRSESFGSRYAEAHKLGVSQFFPQNNVYCFTELVHSIVDEIVFRENGLPLEGGFENVDWDSMFNDTPTDLFLRGFGTNLKLTELNVMWASFISDYRAYLSSDKSVPFVSRFAINICNKCFTLNIKDVDARAIGYYEELYKPDVLKLDQDKSDILDMRKKLLDSCAPLRAENIPIKCNSDNSPPIVPPCPQVFSTSQKSVEAILSKPVFLEGLDPQKVYPYTHNGVLVPCELPKTIKEFRKLMPILFPIRLGNPTVLHNIRVLQDYSHILAGQVQKKEEKLVVASAQMFSNWGKTKLLKANRYFKTGNPIWEPKWSPELCHDKRFSAFYRLCRSLGCTSDDDIMYVMWAISHNWFYMYCKENPTRAFIETYCYEMDFDPWVRERFMMYYDELRHKGRLPNGGIQKKIYPKHNDSVKNGSYSIYFSKTMTSLNIILETVVCEYLDKFHPKDIRDVDFVDVTEGVYIPTMFIGACMPSDIHKAWENDIARRNVIPPDVFRDYKNPRLGIMSLCNNEFCIPLSCEGFSLANLSPADWIEKPEDDGSLLSSVSVSPHPMSINQPTLPKTNIISDIWDCTMTWADKLDPNYGRIVVVFMGSVGLVSLVAAAAAGVAVWWQKKPGEIDDKLYEDDGIEELSEQAISQSFYQKQTAGPRRYRYVPIYASAQAHETSYDRYVNILKQSRPIRFFDGQGLSVDTNILFITPTEGVVPAHAFYCLNVEKLSLGDCHGENFQPYSSSEYTYRRLDKDRDGVVLSFKMPIYGVRNVKNSVPTSVLGFSTSPMRLMKLRKSDGKQEIVQVFSSGKKMQYIDASIQSSVISHGKEIVTSMKGYYLVTDGKGLPGFCAFPWVSLDDLHQNQPIFGFHVARLGNDSIVCPLFASDFISAVQVETAFAQMFSPDTICLDVPDQTSKFNVCTLASNLNSKTAYEPTLISPYLPKVNVSPAHLEVRVENDVRISPLKNACSKYAKFPPREMPSVLSQGLKDPHSIFRGLYPSGYIYKELTFEEAVFGDGLTI